MFKTGIVSVTFRKKSIDEIDMPSVKRFMEEFVPSFSLTLDELN